MLPAPSRTPSRRTLLRGLGGLAAGAGLAAAGVSVAPPALAKNAKPVRTSSVLGADAGLHLLRRASFGLSPSAIADLRAQGTTAWLNAQLRPAGTPDPVEDLVGSRLPRLGWTPAQVRAAYPQGSADVLNDLVAATMARAVWSKRQLQEVMVDFWSNHLNVPASQPDLWDTRHLLDPITRSLALTSFSSLLKATITQPAMLRYLNNDVSSKDGINENLGRELLECHTVGVDAGYTQADVVDSARILTGAGIGDDGTYLYRPERHATGRVNVLDFTHANSTVDGSRVLTAYLTYLATHPATARRIATKLAVRFVSDTPPSSLVDTLTQVYVDQKSAIVPVLRALFTSNEFAAAIGQKVRRPYEDLYATVRVLDIDLNATTSDTFGSLVGIARTLGHVPLYRPTPDGYPDTAAAYASARATLGRLNVHQMTPWGYFPGLPAPAAYGTGALTTLGPAVDQLADRFLDAPLTAAHRQAVLDFVGQPADADVSSWGWRGVEYLVVPLLLDSPYFTSR